MIRLIKMKIEKLSLKTTTAWMGIPKVSQIISSNLLPQRAFKGLFMHASNVSFFHHGFQKTNTHGKKPKDFFFSCIAAIILVKSFFWPLLYVHKEHRKGLFFSCTTAMIIQILLVNTFVWTKRAFKGLFLFMYSSNVPVTNCPCDHKCIDTEHLKGFFFSCRLALCLFKTSLRSHLY